MNNNFDLLSIGDASLDVFIHPTESETLCSLKDRECLICFSYGDKIPVKDLVFSIGGNAANNSIGASRLGVRTAGILTIGDDTTGKHIRETLEKEKVDMNYVYTQPNSNSNFSSVITYSGERTIFVYHAPREYRFPDEMPNSSWVYLTSMGETFRPFYERFLEWKKNHPEVKLAFNPGSWQFRAGIDSFRTILEVTDLLFVNREEAEKITGKKAETGQEKELLSELAKIGVKIAVITDGGNGSYVYDGQRYLHCGVLPVDAFERTGAGDAFGSGFLASMIKGNSVDDSLFWGTVNSSSVIGYTGAQRGLLKSEEIGEWIERAKSSGVGIKQI